MMMNRLLFCAWGNLQMHTVCTVVQYSAGLNQGQDDETKLD